MAKWWSAPAGTGKGVRCVSLGLGLLLSSTAFSAWSAAPYAEGPLLDLVRAMPEGSWQKVNTNSYSEAWTPSALRPLYVGTIVPPSKIIGAWSSFAWDSNRGDLIIYGGGHANYSGNDVYRWRARTLRWERAALPSETVFIGKNNWTAIDGADAAPTSAHTYDNAVFLPRADRYLNFGGAIYNSGSGYVRPSEADPNIQRYTGPYLFDPSRADPNKVGGTTGSHVQRVAPFPEILGGEMWQNRDLMKNLPSSLLPRSFVNGCTAYSHESAEHDVVYIAARTNPAATAIDLYRYQITDVSTPSLDVMTRVGRYSSSPSAQTTCGFDPVANVVLRTGSNTSPLYYWSLATPGSTNYEKRVSVTGSVKTLSDQLTAMGRAISSCAMDYDPNRQRHVLWCGAGQVWSVRAPEPLAVDGWEVERLDPAVGQVPPNDVGVGILGKWEYIPGFDVFIGLVGSVDGNIWVYKPDDWVDPGGSGGGPIDNLAPLVELETPVDGAVILLATGTTLRAQASDTDGSIAQVVFRAGNEIVGVATAPPYAVEWLPQAAGVYLITAEATDDRGAVTVSAEAEVLVEAPPPVGEGGTVLIQRSEGGDFQVADTYLSTYHKTYNFGGSARMDVWRHSYVPLLRFSIFASEGGPVPDGALIRSARLHIYKGSYDTTLALHAMLVPWEESEATWNRPRIGSNWSVEGAAGAGADYDAQEDARVSAPWAAGWMAFDVTDRVDRISTGEVPNYGWRTLWISGNNNRIELRSSEYSVYAERRPTLEVEWVWIEE